MPIRYNEVLSFVRKGVQLLVASRDIFLHFTKTQYQILKLLIRKKLRECLVKFIYKWNQEECHPFRWHFSGY